MGAPFGHIKNDYDDYLGTGQPLKTDDDLRAVAARYLFRGAGDWFIGGQGSAANYQVLGASPEDALILETLGVRGFKSAALGAVVMHDSRSGHTVAATCSPCVSSTVGESHQYGVPAGFRSIHAVRKV